MSSADYLYEEGDVARERLAQLSALMDDDTKAAIERLGIKEGWTCLELGPGTGSISLWLAERVGPSGRVVALDIDTTSMADVSHDRIEIREEDIFAADLGRDAFDLVVARNFFEHLPEVESVVERVRLSIRPGGWLWLVDAWRPYWIDPSVPSDVQRSWAVMRDSVIKASAAASGRDDEFGWKAATLLRAAGFTDVQVDGHANLVVGGEPGAQFWKATCTNMVRALNSRGLVEPSDIESHMWIWDDPRLLVWIGVPTATWGQRPLNS